MSFTRSRSRIAALACLSLSLVAVTVAQAPSQTTQSVPAPTPVPSDSYPSVPAPTAASAATPATQVPPSTPVATPVSKVRSLPPYDPDYDLEKHPDNLGSTYIPVDSPIYPMVLRLYSLGYLDSAFIGMRPWTRQSLLHILQKSSDDIVNDDNQQAMEILAKLQDYLADETPAAGFNRGTVYGVDTLYTRLMGINGQSLRDSFHLGQTIVNDYGRPYEPGFNAIAGFSTVNEMGRFSLYVRGEYQHAPSGPGYSLAMATQLSNVDGIPFAAPNEPQATIPYGTQVAQNPFRLQEAMLSFHLLGHEISGGKSDSWDGPGLGSGMLWSNNAENMYTFRLNRVEPLHIPYFSAIFGDIRYDFLVGSLKGHTSPNSPWMHTEIISMRPTKNFEFAFERSVIWGGKDHEPVTLHTFLRSFFSLQDTESNPASKGTAQDPGDRLSDFTFSYRLPFLRDFATLYLDSICHDDVSPISAPRRAAYRPGLYLSHLPGIPKMDFRIEGASTDTSTLRSMAGAFIYDETIQKQGYTNKGFIMGDWMGREAKGGQAWLTWHFSPDQFVQAEYLTKETAKDFIAGGVTQSDLKFQAVKHLHRDIELNAWVQLERWKAPVPLTVPSYPLAVTGGPLYYPNAQHDTTIAAQITWYPKLHTIRSLNGKEDKQ